MYVLHLSKREVHYAYRVFFTFNLTRLYINLWDCGRRNYASLSVGLFLKFFNKKRALKKNRVFRFLLVRFFRKLLITANIKNMALVFKRTPRDLLEIFRFLCSPLKAPFFNPVTQKVIEETRHKYHKLNIRYLYFLKSISYTSMKYRKKGRVKRKISRKVIKKNKLMD